MLAAGTPGSVLIRAFARSDIPDALSLSSRLGWPQTLRDWHWLGAWSQGFVASYGNTIVGTALYWDYTVSIGSIGAVMVDAKMQGMGIGRRLMDACIQALPGRSIILHATEAGRPLYERLGFESGGLLVQHQGSVSANEEINAICFQADIVPLTGEHFERVIGLAESASGLRRNGFFSSLLERSAGAVLLRTGEVTGFSLFRPYGAGWVIGPVVAPDAAGGRALIAHWIRLSAGREIRLDLTAQVGSDLASFLSRAGMVQVATALPMVRGFWPKIDGTWCQYAIVTQATG